MNENVMKAAKIDDFCTYFMDKVGLWFLLFNKIII